ncbi:hypothetical protein B0J14DRAFT_325891 [Halenospora varia]|nr:hypothetical protein B0J14DRAFT_325891 [Halenospora varia]
MLQIQAFLYDPKYFKSHLSKAMKSHGRQNSSPEALLCPLSLLKMSYSAEFPDVQEWRSVPHDIKPICFKHLRLGRVRYWSIDKFYNNTCLEMLHGLVYNGISVHQCFSNVSQLRDIGCCISCTTFPDRNFREQPQATGITSKPGSIPELFPVGSAACAKYPHSQSFETSSSPVSIRADLPSHAIVKIRLSSSLPSWLTGWIFCQNV